MIPKRTNVNSTCKISNVNKHVSIQDVNIIYQQFNEEIWIVAIIAIFNDSLSGKFDDIYTMTNKK